MRGLLIGLSLCVLAATGRAATDDVSDHRRTLANLQAELVEHRAALKDLSNQERSILLTIRSLDRALSKFEAEGRQAERTVEQLRQKRERLTAEVAVLTQTLDGARARLSRRWRTIYAEGQGGAVRHLLSSHSFEDYAYRYRYLAARAQIDRALLAQVETVRTDKAAREQALREAEQNADALRNALVEQGRIVELVRAERKDAVAQIEQQKALGVRAVTENVALQKEVQRELVSLLRKAPPRRRPPQGVLKAGLRRPLSGAIFRDFGTVKDKVTGAKVTSNGIHIRAALGTKVLSPGDGTVVYTGWLRGFGQMVIIDLGEHTHVLLGHLSRSVVKRGDLVARGQVVGYSGDTESMDGPQLYLELRRKSRPINPARYLRSS